MLYDAGVDVAAADALGHLELSDAALGERDHLVLRECVRRRVPVAAVVGGGYDRDRRALARRHASLHRAAIRVWNEMGMAADSAAGSGRGGEERLSEGQ